MRPSIRQLEYFVALAEQLSFRKAAEATFVTQPALSTQIQQLEALLGVQLFERDRRKVLLTPAGQLLVERAIGVLRDVDGILDEARGLTEPLSGRLRLGVIPTVAPYALPRTLAAVRREFPNLKVYLREDQTARLIEALHQGDLDVLFLALEAELGDVESLAVYHDPFLMAVPKEHPLASCKRIREKDLAGQELLLLADGHCLRDQTLSICQLAGARESGDFRASSLNTLVRMVAGQIGVTLLPSMAVPFEVRAQDDLVTIPFQRPVPGRTIGLVWRRSSPRKKEYRMLAEHFLARAPAGVEPLT